MQRLTWQKRGGLLWRMGVLLVLGGCGQPRPPTIVVDGHRLPPGHWRHAIETVRAQASYDLRCPPDALQFDLFDVRDMRPRFLGARGCGRGHRYVLLHGAWYNVLDERTQRAYHGPHRPRRRGPPMFTGPTAVQRVQAIQNAAPVISP